MSSLASSVFRVCFVVLVCAVLFGCVVCVEYDAAAGTADVTASDVLDGSVESSGRVAALLTPRLAACVVKAQVRTQ